MSHFNFEHDPVDQLYINPFVQQYVYLTLIALAWCNAIELIILCFNTFKRYAGSYFWTLFLASLGIIPFGLGYFLKIYKITFSHYFLEIIISDIGWSALVTGQSLVLWSRLHLVLHNRYILRSLLYLIIFDGVLLHTSCTALELATNALPKSMSVALAFGIIERIQLVWFCLQELLISGFYIYATIQLLKLDESPFSRGILTQLIVVNIIINLLDMAVVAIQYIGFFTFQVTFKGLVYSIKLKLEYAILGRLVKVAHIRTQMDAARFQL